MQAYTGEHTRSGAADDFDAERPDVHELLLNEYDSHCNVVESLALVLTARAGPRRHVSAANIRLSNTRVFNGGIGPVPSGLRIEDLKGEYAHTIGELACFPVPKVGYKQKRPKWRFFFEVLEVRDLNYHRYYIS